MSFTCILPLTWQAAFPHLLATREALFASGQNALLIESNRYLQGSKSHQSLSVGVAAQDCFLGLFSPWDPQHRNIQQAVGAQLYALHRAFELLNQLARLPDPWATITKWRLTLPLH